MMHNPNHQPSPQTYAAYAPPTSQPQQPLHVPFSQDPYAAARRDPFLPTTTQHVRRSSQGIPGADNAPQAQAERQGGWTHTGTEHFLDFVSGTRFVLRLSGRQCLAWSDCVKDMSRALAAEASGCCVRSATCCMTRRMQKLQHVRSDSSHFTACCNAPGCFWCTMQSLNGDCGRRCMHLVSCTTASAALDGLYLAVRACWWLAAILPWSSPHMWLASRAG